MVKYRQYVPSPVRDKHRTGCSIDIRQVNIHNIMFISIKSTSSFSSENKAVTGSDICSPKLCLPSTPQSASRYMYLVC